MPLTIRHVVESLAWGTATFGALQFVQFEALFDGCSICGPWGCSPPPEAMIAAHGFWLVVFLALVRVASGSLSARRLRLLGRSLTALGLLALVGVVAWVLLTWLPESAARQKYVVQRILFVFATLTDAPVVQTTLAGTAMWVIGGVRTRRHLHTEGAQIDPDPSAGDVVATHG